MVNRENPKFFVKNSQATPYKDEGSRECGGRRSGSSMHREEEKI